MKASPEVLHLQAYLKLLENPLPATEGIMVGVFVNMNWVCRVLERQDELRGAKYLINFLGQETSAAKFPGGVAVYKKL